MKPDILIFDLDGTLAPSKSVIQPDMAEVLNQLLEKGKVIVVISGGKFSQFENQLLSQLKAEKGLFRNMYILTTSGSAMYVWDQKNNDWKEEYAKTLNEDEKKKIIRALEKVISESDVDFPEQTYGDRIEDRNTQISMSALGQKAPLEKKRLWDPDQQKRKKMLPELQKLLPEFDVKLGGTTTIDITHKGITKEFGVNEFFKYTNLNKEDSIFYGDALFPGGNDYEVVKTGVKTQQISGPEELVLILKEYL